VVIVLISGPGNLKAPMEQIEAFGFHDPHLPSYLKNIIGILQLGIPAITIRTLLGNPRSYCEVIEMIKRRLDSGVE